MKKREERLSPKGTPRWAGHERQWTCWLRPETHRITTDGDRLIDVVYFEFIQASFSRPTPFACSLNGVPSAGNVWSKERPGVFFLFSILFYFIFYLRFFICFFFSLSFSRLVAPFAVQPSNFSFSSSMNIFFQNRLLKLSTPLR